MIVERLIASFVSSLLSFTGVSATTDGEIVYVPSLDHRFIVTLSCIDWVSVFLWGFMYVFVVWVYFALNNRPMSRRSYLVLGFVGFAAFFLANVLRIFLEIFLVATVYSSVFQHYLVSWQAFEEQVGLGLMFATFSILFLVSYAVLKRKWRQILPVTLKFQELERKSAV